MAVLPTESSYLTLSGVALAIFLIYLLASYLMRNAPFYGKSRFAPVTLDEKASLPDGVHQSRFSKLGEISALESFDWQTAHPRVIRPFKPRYHLTMALETSDVSKLIQMDNQYLDRIHLRGGIMSQYPSTVLGCLPNSENATREFYDFLIETYLPKRYPKMFAKQDHAVLNLVTNTSLPTPAPDSALDALRIIGANLDEDFLVLLPSPDGDGYMLQAFIGCFPSGFDTSKKCGLKLRDIHIPVPKYKQKLETSMDRYFAKLETGKFVRRVNWSIAISDELFAAFKKTHTHEGNAGDDYIEPQLDVSNIYQRTELQTLFRLPESGALIFCIKTYMYPLQQIKDEGLGETFAQAIEGLQTGSVPEMHVYKRSAVWGDTVKDFLRS